MNILDKLIDDSNNTVLWLKYKKVYELLGRPPVSSKNSKRICRGRLINNQKTMDYKAWAKPKIMQMKKQMIADIGEEFPARIHFQFIFPDHRRRDYINFGQCIQDLLVECEVLPDDDYMHLVPVFDEAEVNTDKDKCGIKIWIEQ